jgi:protein O-mannosyl-transferase
LSITISFLLLVRSRPYLMIGWLWYLGNLFPMIGLIQAGNQAMADSHSFLIVIPSRFIT